MNIEVAPKTQLAKKMDPLTAMPSPKVSVIIIFLNGEKYLQEAIESVLAQTFGDWELILVDDGSTDGATCIAKKFAEAHAGKIIYTEHPDHENRGMSASRNAGLELPKANTYRFWMPTTSIFRNAWNTTLTSLTPTRMSGCPSDPH